MVGRSADRLAESMRRAFGEVDAWVNRLYGSRLNPLYHSGAIVVVLLMALTVTGLYLLLFYRLGSPWASVAAITEQAWTGRWIRGVHRFASDAAVLAAAIHGFRMYAQRRSWGPRSLAWMSGLVLVGLVLVSGWTGYVMVWDVHGQLLAMEGARLLDALPLFSEPLARAFTGEEALSSAFFFLNLFAHIALPMGLLLLLWLHVGRVARPKLIPPKEVTVAVVAGLVGLAVLWPLGMAPEADPFRQPGAIPLDLFYGFWLPLTQRASPWAVWLGGSALVAGLALVPVLTRPKPGAVPSPSVVDDRACTGCEQCALDCPYGVITMVPREDGRVGIVARVEDSLCVSCGICIGSCAPMALGPVGRTGRDQLAHARLFVAEHGMAAPDVVVVGCRWSGSRAAAARDGTKLPHFTVECAGNVHTSTLEFLLRGGVGAVVVAHCPGSDCRGREGVKWLVQRVHHGREAELKERVDRSRLRMVEVPLSPSWGEPDPLETAVADVRATIAALAADVREMPGPTGDEECESAALPRVAGGSR